MSELTISDPDTLLEQACDRAAKPLMRELAQVRERMAGLHAREEALSEMLTLIGRVDEVAAAAPPAATRTRAVQQGRAMPVAPIRESARRPRGSAAGGRAVLLALTDGPASAATLVQVTDVSESTVSRRTRELEAEGLVRRDERTQAWTITDDGRASVQSDIEQVAS